MQKRLVIFVALLMCSTVCSVAWGQTTSTPSSGAQSGSQQSMPGMDMSGHDMSNMQMKAMPMGDKEADSDTSAHVMKSMEGHMDMGPNMKMTDRKSVMKGKSEERRVGKECRS